MYPRKHLEYYAKVYPDAWKQVDWFRSLRDKEIPPWPEWCFLPLSGAYTIVLTEGKRNGVIKGDSIPPGRMVSDVGILGALAAWRVTQGVYRFAPDVLTAVLNTSLTEDIPPEVLFNLPEWCVYVETPTLTDFNGLLKGFFAHLEYDLNTSRRELRLVLDFSEDTAGAPALFPMILPLGQRSITESIELTVKEIQQQGERGKVLAATRKKEFEVLISLLLYLCASDAEIGNGQERPVKPRSTKTKKGERFFPPDSPRVWNVGARP